MKPTFRSKVYRVAYELYHTTGKSWPICLTRAWAIYHLTRQMHRGVVNFAYERADGTLRKAKGTPDECRRQNQRHRQNMLQNNTLLRCRSRRLPLL
ncbi:MAG: SH3 beta-barrel fold-containing protein [Tannerellaceae bacterium]|nr:SH3 beta-barrel fold-containing protein [Tannerellaceae bacterium]